MDSRADTLRPAHAAGVPDDALEEINRLWTVVRAFTNMAHDVNNALQVISGSAELIAGRRELDESIGRRVQAIRQQAERAARTIEQLRAYSRDTLEGPQVLDLASLVATALRMRHCSLTNAQVSAHVEQRDEAPHWVAVERRRTLQLLLNLLLSVELGLTRGTPARLLVHIDRNPSEVRVTIDGQIDGGGATARSGATPLDEVAKGTPLWTASRLATGQRGSLRITSDGDRLATVTLTLPAASEPSRG